MNEIHVESYWNFYSNIASNEDHHERKARFTGQTHKQESKWQHEGDMSSVKRSL